MAKRVFGFFKTVAMGFLNHRCALHAAGLTYFTLMAIVPILCLLMVCAKVCGAGDFAREKITGYVDAFIASVEKGAQPAATDGKPAAEMTPQQRKNWMNGPGKVCKGLSLSRAENGMDLTGNTLFL